MAAVPAPVVATAAAICRLQTQIAISTCISCHGHGKQAMVLEPFASAPCARCHGEGVTHDVPPGCYGAVLTALLDALGGAGVEQVAKRLAPLLDHFNTNEETDHE